MLVVFVVQTMDIGQDALFNLVGGTLTLINPIVSLLDVELDTALELTNLLYERLVLFVMECTNVFKLLDVYKGYQQRLLTFHSLETSR